MSQDTEDPILDTLPHSSLVGQPKAVIEKVEQTLQHPSSEYRDATAEEISTLDTGIDQIPSGVWVVALIGASERFAYYSVTAPWQNYMQNPPGALLGALGLGKSRATIVYNAFFFLTYLAPMPMAILSDTRLGRFKTLCLSLSIDMIGMIVMFVTSLPRSLRHGAGIPGITFAMIFIAVGAGGVRSSLSAFIIDQYPESKPKFIKRKGKAPYIGDRTATIQYIFNVYYWFINIAGLSSIPATWIEKKHGFWAAYLFSFCSLGASVVLLLAYSNKFVKVRPQGNILPMAIKCLITAVKGGFNLQSASPTYQLEHHGKTVPWSEEFIREMKRGLVSCRVLFNFIFFYLCFDQIQNNLVSQANQMKLGGVPNDMVQALNPRHKISFLPIVRMTVGFFAMAAAMGFASGLQHWIYSTGPCYNQPLNCTAAGKDQRPNNISIWFQTPVYFILAISEILSLVTAMEYAYSKAPRHMKAVVQSFNYISAAAGAGLGIAVSPAARNPFLVILYASLAGLMVVVSVVFWVLFQKYDDIDEDMNRLET